MSEHVGFCCRCGKETERQEQVGLITAWVCSTSCAHQASLEFVRPSTPELDKLQAAMPFHRVAQEFIDWLWSDEQVIKMKICQVLGPYPNNHWIEAEETPEELLNRFFNLDPEKIEAEKRLLEETILEYQSRARSRGPT